MTDVIDNQVPPKFTLDLDCYDNPDLVMAGIFNSVKVF